MSRTGPGPAEGVSGAKPSGLPPPPPGEDHASTDGDGPPGPLQPEPQESTAVDGVSPSEAAMVSTIGVREAVCAPRRSLMVSGLA